MYKECIQITQLHIINALPLLSPHSFYLSSHYLTIPSFLHLCAIPSLLSSCAYLTGNMAFKTLVFPLDPFSQSTPARSAGEGDPEGN